MRLKVLLRTVVAATLGVASVLVGLSLSETAPAYAAATTAPRCKASQIRETFQPVKVAKNSQQSYKAWVVFVNNGRRCAMSTVDLGLEALSGASVLEASATPVNYIAGTILLQTGQSSRAQAAVMRTSSFGKGCNPKAANGLVVLPLYPGWPKKTIHLTSQVPVCTGGDINIVGNYLSKSP